MGNCNEKVSNTCGSIVNSTCVKYDSNIGDNSGFNNNSCLTVEDVIGDLYDITDKLNSDIYLGLISDSCIDYQEFNNNSVKIKTAIKKHHQLLCDIISKLESINNVNITEWGLDYKCLITDPCNGGFNSMKDLMQAIINKVCQI